MRTAASKKHKHQDERAWKRREQLRRTRLSQEMVLDTMTRFRGCKPVGREDVRKILQEVLNRSRCGEKGDRLKERLRPWRSTDHDVFRAVRKDSLVNQVVEVSQKICAEQRNRHRS